MVLENSVCGSIRSDCQLPHTLFSSTTVRLSTTVALILEDLLYIDIIICQRPVAFS